MRILLICVTLFVESPEWDFGNMNDDTFLAYCSGTDFATDECTDYYSPEEE